MMASDAAYNLDPGLVIAFVSPTLIIAIILCRRLRRDKAAKDAKRYELQSRGTNEGSKESSLDAKISKIDGKLSKKKASDLGLEAKDLESLATDTAGTTSTQSRARELWQVGIKKAMEKGELVDSSSSSLPLAGEDHSARSAQLWKKGIRAAMAKSKKAQMSEAPPRTTFKMQDSVDSEDAESSSSPEEKKPARDWWTREDSDEEPEEVVAAKKAKENPLDNLKPRPTVSMATADIASQRVQALYENRGALAAALSVQSISHADTRCAAERALMALGDDPASPRPVGHAPSPVAVKFIPGFPAPPPPGEPPQFAFTRPEESACRFRFNCSCRKFRGVEATCSRPPTREKNMKEAVVSQFNQLCRVSSEVKEKNHGSATAPDDIDWQAPCLDCGHARMYHRRTPSASGTGNRIRRPTPFEILEGFVPPWRQIHGTFTSTNHAGEFLYYNPRTCEIRNVDDGIERFDEKAAVDTLGPRTRRVVSGKDSPKAKQSSRNTRKTQKKSTVGGAGARSGSPSKRETQRSPSK